jgi:hypothetical protein
MILADRVLLGGAEGANGGTRNAPRPHFGPLAGSRARSVGHGPRAFTGGPLPREAS